MGICSVEFACILIMLMIISKGANVRSKLTPLDATQGTQGQCRPLWREAKEHPTFSL